MRLQENGRSLSAPLSAKPVRLPPVSLPAPKPRAVGLLMALSAVVLTPACSRKPAEGTATAAAPAAANAPAAVTTPAAPGTKTGAPGAAPTTAIPGTAGAPGAPGAPTTGGPGGP